MLKRQTILTSLALFFLVNLQSVHAGDVFKGKEIYTRHCMGCHGPSGEGMMPGLPNFSRGAQLSKTDSQLMDAIRDGNGVMPSFNGLLDDDELSDVVSYLRTFL